MAEEIEQTFSIFVPNGSQTDRAAGFQHDVTLEVGWIRDFDSRRGHATTISFPVISK
jgi:hypothetical protein